MRDSIWYFREWRILHNCTFSPLILFSPYYVSSFLFFLRFFYPILFSNSFLRFVSLIILRFVDWPNENFQLTSSTGAKGTATSIGAPYDPSVSPYDRGFFFSLTFFLNLEFLFLFFMCMWERGRGRDGGTKFRKYCFVWTHPYNRSVSKWASLGVCISFLIPPHLPFSYLFFLFLFFIISHVKILACQARTLGAVICRGYLCHAVLLRLVYSLAISF